MTESDILIPLISLLLLLFLSAFFSGTETALMAISRLRLRHLAETKPKRTKTVEGLLKEPDKLIGTILLGNNLVNVAMTALATSLAIRLWGDKGIVYVTGALTIIILIFAEITPKVYAKYFKERVSFQVAPIMKLIKIFLKPVVGLITYTSTKILYLLGLDIKKVETPLITESELKTFIKVSRETGAISPDEKKILTRVFTLNDKTVGELMTPAKKMVILEKNALKEEILKKIIRTGHSRFPVRSTKTSEIEGIVIVKDLLGLIAKKKNIALKKIIRPLNYASEDDKIDKQLRRFQRNRIHQAMVLDKEGNISGLITLEDILEELVGSIKDEHDFGWQ
jgi:Mg2+/Co2+ transporter CorB